MSQPPPPPSLERLKGVARLPGIDQLTVEQVCLGFHVPYWLITGQPRPPWWRQPVWRLRALLWKRR